MAFLSTICLVFLSFTPSIVGLLTSDATLAVYGLRVMSLGFPLYAADMVMEQDFNGAGDSWTPTWLKLLALPITHTPLVWFLAGPIGLHERGVLISVTVAYSVLAVVSGVLFRRGKWKLKYV